ncbi:MAG: dihydropteroate synthase, partial [Prevotella sp.]|nr:dihydropteroate synthase [Prevotella sp.]
GCCGTTPEHIRTLKGTLTGKGTGTYTPRPLPVPKAIKPMRLSGLEELVIDHSTFINVGERTNVAGSAKFKKLIQAKDYEAALSVARQQVENGAQVIDICMDDGLIDGVEAMTTFLNLIASEPEIARVPVMIDSSKWEILKAGLECVQGKSIVNSISLKEGEEKFLEKARHIHSMGAATVVMLFDEEGQADTYERKVSVARRAYKLLKGIGFPTEDIIFDPNVLAVATGMPEHDDYARAFIEACRTIHEEMPEVHMSGGISNLSFSFRGNNTIRQAMHSVFLYHAMQAGLDMSIVNPAMTTIYSDIPQDMLQVVEDVILNKKTPSNSPLKGENSTPAERLIEYAEKIKEESQNNAEKSPFKGDLEGRGGESIASRISQAMLKGLTDNIEADTEEAYKEAGSALGVIDNYLMPAMEQVGKLFGEGKMFLPQVVKSARVMKKAVAVLEPYMKSPLPTSPEKGRGVATSSCKDNTQAVSPSPFGEGRGEAGSVLMATVKGDVHDIGKNIVCVVTQCNGYEVEDLGVMVDTQTIVDTAQKNQVDVIGLSGLITPSLDEMIKVVQELQRRGMKTPVIVGGATTSALHTAVKMAPEYPNGVVIQSHSAADNAAIIRRLLADDHEEYIAEQKNQQRIVRETYLNEKANKKPQLSMVEARQRRHQKRVGEVALPKGDTSFDLKVRVKDI